MTDREQLRAEVEALIASQFTLRDLRVLMVEAVDEEAIRARVSRMSEEELAAHSQMTTKHVVLNRCRPVFEFDVELGSGQLTVTVEPPGRLSIETNRFKFKCDYRSRTWQFCGGRIRVANLSGELIMLAFSCEYVVNRLATTRMAESMRMTNEPESV